MSRSKVTLYVSDEEKRQLETEAEENDQSVSAYGKQLLDRGRMAEAEESLTSRTDVEAAIERTIQQTTEDYHADLLNAVEKAAVYSIANYELAAGSSGFGAPGSTRQDTFATGRRRTHRPLDTHRDARAASAEVKDSADTTVADKSESGEESESDSTGSEESSEDSGGLVSDIRSRTGR
jgi:hypothetical protein